MELRTTGRRSLEVQAKRDVEKWMPFQNDCLNTGEIVSKSNWEQTANSNEKWTPLVLNI